MGEEKGGRWAVAQSLRKDVRDSPSPNSAGGGEGNQSFNSSHRFCGRPRSQRFKLKDQMHNLGIFPDMLWKQCLTVTKLVALSKVQPLSVH